MGWLVVFFGVGMLIFILYSFADSYEASGGDWTKNLSGLAGAAAGSSIAVAVASWLVFINHLTVTITNEGVQYVFVPTFWKARTVAAASIVSFEVRTMSFWEYLSAGGRHKSIPLASRKKEVCVIRSFTVADLALANGRHLLLGTKNPDGMRWALKKLKGME